MRIVIKPKEFKVTRRRVTHESIYISAEDWEDAERIACEKEHDWEYLYSHDHLEVEEQS